MYRVKTPPEWHANGKRTVNVDLSEIVRGEDARALSANLAGRRSGVCERVPLIMSRR